VAAPVENVIDVEHAFLLHCAAERIVAVMIGGGDEVWIRFFDDFVSLLPADQPIVGLEIQKVTPELGISFGRFDIRWKGRFKSFLELRLCRFAEVERLKALMERLVLIRPDGEQPRKALDALEIFRNTLADELLKFF